MKQRLRQLGKASIRAGTRFGAAIALSGLMLTVAVPTARGAPTAAGVASPTYCIGELQPFAGAPVQQSCYPTFGASIAAATGGRVQLANATTARYVSPSELSAGAAPGVNGVILSIDFSGSNYTGITYTWYGGIGCGYYFANGMAPGWNDRIRSVITQSGCANTLYWDGNWGPPVYFIGVNTGVADLGSFDNQTSSQKWCPAIGCL